MLSFNSCKNFKSLQNLKIEIKTQMLTIHKLNNGFCTLHTRIFKEKRKSSNIKIYDSQSYPFIVYLYIHTHLHSNFQQFMLNHEERKHDFDGGRNSIS